MVHIVLVTVIAVLLLQASGVFPSSSVGGPLAIAAVLFAGAAAVAIQEAVVRKRGALGWIVNLAAALTGAFVAAPLGGFLAVMLVGSFTDVSGSLAATGGPALYLALAGQAIVTLLGAWGALWVVNRWR